MIVPVADGARHHSQVVPSLADDLLAIHELINAERNTTPLRGIYFARRALLHPTHGLDFHDLNGGIVDLQVGLALVGLCHRLV